MIKIPTSFNHQPTKEQLTIVEYVLGDKFKRLAIPAAAGSAKTSTLQLIAENKPVKSIYLAYNKAMADEARTKFPAWVEVRTTHSLAYKEVGYKYQDKLMRPSGKYMNVLGTGNEIAKKLRIEEFKISDEKTLSANALGYFVRMTVTKYEQSADVSLIDEHVYFNDSAWKSIKQLDESQQYLKYKELSKLVLKYAKTLWKKRIDLDDPCLISHDTYLKLYQLSNPDLSNYDLIYMDEMQDTNACVMSIAQNQHTSKIIVVGDSFQAIYQWRGAVDAMSRLKWKELKLTKSFRFGQDVADLANNLLMDVDMQHKLTNIRGFEILNTKVHLSAPKDLEGDVCYIYRTNAALIEDALEMIDRDIPICVNADVTEFRKKLESANFLFVKNPDKVTHQDIVGFITWEEMVQESKEVFGELARIVKIIEDGRYNRIIRLLQNFTSDPNADIILTTSHKVKGLEYDNVIIAGDFEPHARDKQTDDMYYVSEADRNLLYVAATRAKKNLVINNSILEILQYVKERGIK